MLHQGYSTGGPRATDDPCVTLVQPNNEFVRNINK